MKITKEKAARLKELLGELRGRLDEMTTILRGSMSRSEWESARHTFIGDIQGGISDDYGWVGRDETLEKLVEKAQAVADGQCEECGKPLSDNGHCTNEECDSFGEEPGD